MDADGHEYIANEDNALLKYPLNFQGGYAFVNQDRTNRWGIPRGYAIHPGYSPVHNVRPPPPPSDAPRTR